MIAWRIGEVLPNAEVPFCRRNRGMSETDLDLLQSSLSLVGEFRVGSSQVVGRQAGDIDHPAVLLHGDPNRIRLQAMSCERPASVDGSEDRPRLNTAHLARAAFSDSPTRARDVRENADRGPPAGDR